MVTRDSISITVLNGKFSVPVRPSDKGTAYAESKVERWEVQNIV
jgi:hypothetical protein